jgi:thiosulfate reductase cytochrome b subunit
LDIAYPSDIRRWPRFHHQGPLRRSRLQKAHGDRRHRRCSQSVLGIRDETPPGAHAGADADQALFEIGSDNSRDGPPAGFTRIGSSAFETAGGVSRNAAGDVVERGFPRWVTLPSWRDLAMGRRWHFFFAWAFVANLLVYLMAGMANGHFWRDFLPSVQQLRPQSLFRDAADHLRLKFPRGEAARHYNPLQKLTYFTEIFVLLPLMILTGLTMSPGMDAILPWLVDMFGGRQVAVLPNLGGVVAKMRRYRRFRQLSGAFRKTNARRELFSG